MRRRERGFVLALTLLVLAILSVVLSHLFERALAEVQLAQARNDRLEAALGFADTQAELEYRMLTSPMTFAGIGVAPNATRVDDTVYRGDRGTYVSLQDARGLFNLNTSTDARVLSLLHTLGVPGLDANAMLDKLRDYIDEDNLRRLNGAEAPDYAAAGMPPPRNSALRTPVELRNVLGWSDRPELWGKHSIEALTTTARVGFVNPNTAPLEVLMTLPGVTREGAALLMELRKTKTLTETDVIYTGGANPADLLFQVAPLPAETMRVTQTDPKTRWAIRYSVTLTPRDALAPWRIDYAYRVARPDNDLPPDEKQIPALPARNTAPVAGIPELLPPFVRR